MWVFKPNLKFKRRKGHTDECMSGGSRGKGRSGWHEELNFFSAHFTVLFTAEVAARRRQTPEMRAGNGSAEQVPRREVKRVLLQPGRCNSQQ